MSVWSKSITERGAFWGIISGFVGNIIPRFLDVSGIIDLPSYLNPILVGCIISVITILVVSRFGQVSDIEKQRRLELHQMPIEEQSQSETKKTQWAGIAVIIFGLLLSTLLMIYYVYPYQKGTGTLLNNGDLDWFSAEALLALGWAAIYVPLGILTYRIINRSYSSSPKVNTGTETSLTGENSNA
jgi:sodium/pantothenate symporter